MQKGQKHWKQWGVLLLVLLVVPVLSLYGFAAETTASNEPVCYEHGDVNSDGIVDSRDAIYALYYTVYGDTEYPVSQDCDFDQDNEVNSKDAIYLLYGTFDIFGEDYPLNGTVHAFYEPAWSWNADGTVQAALKCGCGKTTTVDATVTEETVEATCVDTGVRTVNAVVEYDGHEFTTQKTEATPARGHNMVGIQSCTESSVCSECGYTLEAYGHKWELSDAEQSTCTQAGSNTYTCTVCGEDYTEELTLAKHVYVYFDDVEVNDCAYYKKYQCSGCGDVYDDTSKTFFNHSYTAKLTKEANCSAEGEITYTCVCGASYTEKVPTNGSHIWDGGVAADGVTTFTCGCGATKTAICVADTAATVTKEDLQATNELQLQNASIALDAAALENLDDEALRIVVDEVDVGSLDLGELAGQIVGGVVYDFNMYCGDDQVTSFGGEVTISIPYVLQEDDDVDCIDIWYIDDEGNVDCYQGTYSNGEVTFTTTHFSYYTVTRLTPAQRCEQYGHAMVSSHRDATCTTDGYDVESCQRCGAKEKNETLSAQGHDYTESINAATCTQDGSKTMTCSVCKNEVTYKLLATGHDWSENAEQSVKASCTQAGKTVYVCNNCDESYAEEEAQLEHSMVTTEQAADCTNAGYTSTVCADCGYGNTEVIPALGHEYLAEDAVWAWAEDYSSATVTLVCSNEVHTVVLNAVVTKTSAANSTCNVVETYAAAASYNGTTYTAEKSITTDVKSHQAGELQTSAAQHYYKCSVCGETVNAESHSWTEKVTKEPTCEQGGTMESTCSVCGYTKQTTLNATGDHNYVNGTCSVCGRVENSCDHVRLYTTEIDLSGYGVCEGGEMWIQSCECGEKSYVFYDLFCYLEYVDYSEVEDGKGSGTYTYVYRCPDCGLTEEIVEAGVYDAATCTVTYYCTSKYTVDGATVAEDAYTGTGSAHSLNVTGETIVLQPEGMCGVTLQVYSCGCGLRTNTYVEESACDFWYSEELSTDTVDVNVCDTCGARVKYYDQDYGFDKETCQEYEYYTCTYEFNGEALCTFTNTWLYTFHNYEVTSYEMYGDSCEDGVRLEQLCANCGLTRSYYSEDHYYVLQETIDLSGQGYCVVELYQYGCPCGEYKGYGYSYGENGGCVWAVLDDNTDACTKCGLRRTLTTARTPQKDENCQFWVTETIKYSDPDGNVLATLYDVWQSQDHDYVKTCSLLAGSETCEDGVRISWTCKDCGYSYYNINYYHSSYEKACYDLSEYGLCGGKLYISGCACDYDNWWEHNFGDCEWESYWDEQLGAWVDACTKCGATFHVTYDDEELGNCQYRENVTVSFTKDGETLLEVSYFNTYTSHSYVYELTLVEGGTSCEDGYTITERCQDCGKTEEFGGVYYDHERWTVERTSYNEGQFCSDVVLIVTSCACGESTDAWINRYGSGSGCDFRIGDWDEQLGAWVYTCTKCGNIRYYIGEATRVEDTCRFLVENTYYYLDSDGNKILSFADSYYYYSHNYVNSFTLLGETCDDGYYRTEVCSVCGETWTDEEVYYGHDNWTLERTMLSPEGQLCGDLYLEKEGCACGEYMDYYTYWSGDYCDVWSYWDEELGTWVYVCETCGAENYGFNYDEPGETACERIRHRTETYRRDGEELFSYEYSYTYESHDYVYTFALLGETCDDGYYRTAVCSVCGYEREAQGPYYGCSTYCISNTVLYDGEGICGPISQKIYSCACGYGYYEGVERSCYYNSEYYDEDQDCWVYVCECGLEWTEQYSRTEKDENCWYNSIWEYTYYLNGEVIANARETNQYTSHTSVATFAMWDESLGCDGGYTVYYTCAVCGVDIGTDYYSGHRTFRTKVEIPGEDSCNVLIYTYSCPCGEESRISVNYDCSMSYDSWSETDADGVTHYFYQYTCENCPFSYVREDWQSPGENVCDVVYHHVYTYYYDGQVYGVGESLGYSTSHTYGTPTLTLSDGAVTCYDGVLVTYNCVYCDYSYSDTAYYHRTGVIGEPIDLRDYGAVCETYLTMHGCACGQYASYELNGDVSCDMDWNYTDSFIEGAIDDSQYTTEGEQYTYSYSYILTCAVTDPQCAFKIRMSQYWLKEGCKAVRYETWQVGYDGETGTYLAEFTVATGESHTYHNYTESFQTTTLDDGTVAYVTECICSDCGSTWTQTYYYLNDMYIGYEEIAVNTLNNGERQKYHEIYKRDLVYNGSTYPTLDYTEYVYAEGSSYWYKYAYEYDLDNGCIRTETYTNSYGVVSVDTSTCHIWSSKYVQVKESTCSQFGEDGWIYTCVNCGEVEEKYYVDYPDQHWWSYDSGLGCYVCWYCGLENANGATGSIVIEDLTEAYGEDTNYVVGYWNKNDIEVLYYVSVVLDDADNEIVLSDVSFTELTADVDGITAITFNQAEAIAAAEAALAEAGYTGSYAIRFAFVPVNSEDTLDYAITFDSLTA